MLFSSSLGVSLPYLHLLHLRDDTTAGTGYGYGPRAALATIRDLVRSNIVDEAQTLSLLRQRDWRPHLVGISTVYFASIQSTATVPVIEQMWDTFDKGSWVSPQVAAILSLVDEDFFDQALTRLDLVCEDDEFDDETISTISKPVGALVGLMRNHGSMDERTALHKMMQDGPNALKIEQLIVEDMELDRGGEISVSWRRDFLIVVDALDSFDSNGILIGEGNVV